MSNNETILTEEQLSQVTETLENNRNETDKLILQIEEDHKDDDNSNVPLEEGEGQYIADGVIIGDGENKEDTFNHFNNIDSDLDKLNDELIQNAIRDQFNMTDEEALKFAITVSKVKNKEKFNVFNELPKSMQEYIYTVLQEQNIPVQNRGTAANYFANELISNFIQDPEFYALSIDLEKAMKELLPSPLEMYSEANKDYIENEFLKTAESIKAKEDATEAELKTADNLLAMRKGYIDAYTFEPMYEIFKDNKILNKVRKSEKLWTRVDNEYKRIAGICKFKLYSLDDIRDSLIRLGLTKSAACKLSALFVYTYTDGIEDPNDIYKNAFANYFEVNVRNLIIAPNIVSNFAKHFKDNLLKLANHIEEAVTEREKELLSNKKKRG